MVHHRFRHTQTASPTHCRTHSLHLPLRSARMKRKRSSQAALDVVAQYLGDDSKELGELADATIVVDGVELPVHCTAHS